MSGVDASLSGGVSEHDRKVVEMLYRAIQGETDLLDSVLAPDWEDIPGVPGQKPGPDGLRPLIDAITAAFRDCTVTIHEIVGSEGRVAVRAEWVGRHTGEWLGVAPTGRVERMRVHEFHHIENGRITHTWHLDDRFGWQ